MKLSETGELVLLRRIRERFAAGSKEVVAGIGDDAAVLAPRGHQLLLTTDMMVEGVHFDRKYITPLQIGFKIISVNVSDIFAMGGTPRFALLDLAVGGDATDEFVDLFFEGVEKAMRFYNNIELIGGDLSSSKSAMAVAATLIGYAKTPVLRSGARPGDRIYVTGSLGDSACGFEVLRRVGSPVPIDDVRYGNRGRGKAFQRKMPISELSSLGLKWDLVEPLIRRHLLPEARDPRPLLRSATAMIDISDGLYVDLTRLCDESGVGARIFMGRIPVSTQMKRTASALGIDPYALAVSGGEDYELLFTAPPRRKVKALCIGEITGGERVVVSVDGRERPFGPEGYRHWH